jgi:hypothetical protein
MSRLSLGSRLSQTSLAVNMRSPTMCNKALQRLLSAETPLQRHGPLSKVVSEVSKEFSLRRTSFHHALQMELRHTK